MQIEGNEAAEAVFDNVFAREEPEAPAAEPTGQPRDENGRFAAREAPAEPQAQAAPVQEAQPQAQPEPQVEPLETQPRMIPLPELQSERQKRREAERRVAEYEGQLKAFEAMFKQQQQPQRQQEVPPAPDPFSDPEGFVTHREREMHLRFRNQLADMSEAIARRQFGDDLVQKAQQWAVQSGTAGHFLMNARDPYGELIDAYRRNEALARIGPDPDAYEKGLEEKIRAKVLAELKAGTATGQPKPSFPGSLASATATGKQGAMLSPQAAADAVFARPGGG